MMSVDRGRAEMAARVKTALMTLNGHGRFAMQRRFA
jgi:hypothetical protein